MNATSVILNVLYYFIYPLILVLSGLRGLLAWLVTPLLHTWHLFVHLGLFPVRVLQRFETVLTYCGIAVGIGVVTGIILHTCSSFIIRSLGLNRPPSKQERPLGHSAASYRAARERKKIVEEARMQKELKTLVPQPILDGGVLKREVLERDRGELKDGLLATTILEEDEDSSVNLP